MTDISTIVAKPRTIEITHPGTRAPLGITVTLRPEHDPQFMAIVRAVYDEALEGEKDPQKLVENQKLTVALAAVCAWDWAGDATFHGEKPTLTLESLRKVLTELPWFQEQVNRGSADRAAFFPVSAAD